MPCSSIYPRCSCFSSRSSSKALVCSGQSREEMGSAMDSAKACSVCRSSKTPLWRNGPDGPKVFLLSPESSLAPLLYLLVVILLCLHCGFREMFSSVLCVLQSLCNACGIKYRKRKRREEKKVKGSRRVGVRKCGDSAAARAAMLTVEEMKRMQREKQEKMLLLLLRERSKKSESWRRRGTPVGIDRVWCSREVAEAALLLLSCRMASLFVYKMTRGTTCIISLLSGDGFEK
ncbi:hypothetical protein HPP92_023067 [Vanilla planifolia]|uniref:GATA-type domain-containing protein n=1 Tax=Vanilla planifolia TaxID=51239 RepID=A0A835UEE6_VANPL|nr:hypothetical protein HPP92_023067 [Vanilla planifolia]